MDRSGLHQGLFFSYRGGRGEGDETGPPQTFQKPHPHPLASPPTLPTNQGNSVWLHKLAKISL